MSDVRTWCRDSVWAAAYGAAYVRLMIEHARDTKAKDISAHARLCEHDSIVDAAMAVADSAVTAIESRRRMEEVTKAYMDATGGGGA